MGKTDMNGGWGLLRTACSPLLLLLVIPSSPALSEAPMCPEPGLESADLMALEAAAEGPPRLIHPTLNAGHVDPGVAIEGAAFYPSRATTGGRSLSHDMFDTPEVCGSCHTEIYRQWKGSMHSNAWKDPVYRALLNRASEATDGLVDRLCIGCHTPIGLTLGEATPSGEGMSTLADNGVQCDFCHNVSGATGIGNGAYVLTPMKYGRRLKFGPFKDAHSPYHDTSYSELHTRSEFCGMCHNVTHPLNRMPIERTYDEWKDSSYAAEGIGCQECHMTPGPGYTRNPGRATPFSKEREHIFTHWFVGANVMVPTTLGADRHADLAREMLQAAATIEIRSPKVIQSNTSVVTHVRVTNVGAGHKLPTGFPEGREMWVDLQVSDAEGRELYRLGAVREGKTEEGTRSFKVVVADKSGKPLDIEVWDADRILYDSRLTPKGTAELEYSFFVPPGVPGPLTVTADLNYWSFPQALVDYLLDDEAPEVPIVRMASAHTDVEIHNTVVEHETMPTVDAAAFEIEAGVPGIELNGHAAFEP